VDAAEFFFSETAEGARNDRRAAVGEREVELLVEAEGVIRLRDLRVKLSRDCFQVFPARGFPLGVEEVDAEGFVDMRKLLARVLERARPPREEAETDSVHEFRRTRATRHGGGDHAGQTGGKFWWHGGHSSGALT